MGRLVDERDLFAVKGEAAAENHHKIVIPGALQRPKIEALEAELRQLGHRLDHAAGGEILEIDQGDAGRRGIALEGEKHRGRERREDQGWDGELFHGACS